MVGSATVTDDQALINNAHVAGMLHGIADLALPGRAHEAGPYASGYLAALWALPEQIVQTLAYYQIPADCPDQNFGPLTAVHAAHALLQEGNDWLSETAGIDMDYLGRTGCGDRVEDWRDIGKACRLAGALA